MDRFIYVSIENSLVLHHARVRTILAFQKEFKMLYDVFVLGWVYAPGSVDYKGMVCIFCCEGISGIPVKATEVWDDSFDL